MSEERQSGTRQPDEVGVASDLAFALRLPDPDDFPTPWPGVVICHGAGSCKENHADFASLAASEGWASLAYDARGHGESEPDLDTEAVADVGRMAEFLAGVEGVDPERVIVRGSSMGGALSLYGACEFPDHIAGAIAICPTLEDGLRYGLSSGMFEMRIGDLDALLAWLDDHRLVDEMPKLAGRPLLLMHAEGDEQVPIDCSRALYAAAGEPKELIEVPGGDHRSVQHDPALQVQGLDWMVRSLEG